VSQSSILFPSERNILMLRAKRHVQENNTRGKIPPWVKVLGRRGKKLYKACI
jgi:hypothetical protein